MPPATQTLDARTIDDPKRARILERAMKVFLAYGFARTTMDDIARAAEVSRPALYLLFRNKTDIYRAIGAGLLEQSVETARMALQGYAAQQLGRPLLPVPPQARPPSPVQPAPATPQSSSLVNR